MTTPQITIVPLGPAYGNAYIVSDKGFISSRLGLGDTPWHILAPTTADIGDRVKRMEDLISKVLKTDKPEKIETVHQFAETSTGPTTVSLNLPAPSKPVNDLTLDGLGLPPAHLWRLKKAGVSDVGSLCGLTAAALSALPGVGPAMIMRIIERLAANGLRLTEKVG